MELRGTLSSQYGIFWARHGMESQYLHVHVHVMYSMCSLYRCKNCMYTLQTNLIVHQGRVKIFQNVNNQRGKIPNTVWSKTFNHVLKFIIDSLGKNLNVHDQIQVRKGKYTLLSLAIVIRNVYSHNSNIANMLPISTCQCSSQAISLT